MELLNALRKVGEPAEWTDADFPAAAEAVRIVAQGIAPLAPHLGEELWHRVGGEGSVFRSGWPQVDPEALRRETVEVPIQVNGKLRSRLHVPPDTAREELERAALADEKVRELLAGKIPVRVVVVPGRLVNVVV
jgi:leucyl-tRNA synthetase